MRAARAEDVAAVVGLELEAAEAPHWAEVEYRAIVSEQSAVRRCLLVAEGETGLVGFAVGKVAAGEAELESVAVRAGARRHGVGRALCAAVVAWASREGAERMDLEVRASSAGAQALYAGLGFRESGRRGGYYADPVEDAVLLRLLLGQAIQ